MSFMYDNLERIEEENVAQKIRQYWADTTISDEEKLLGFEMDLADFDLRNTTFIELRGIALGLLALGVIDGTTAGVMANINTVRRRAGSEVFVRLFGLPCSCFLVG